MTPSPRRRRMRRGVGDTTIDASLVRVIEARAREAFRRRRCSRRCGRDGSSARTRRAFAAPSRALVTRLDSARAALGPSRERRRAGRRRRRLAAGADATAVRAVRAASAGRPVSAPLGALAQLVASGVPSTRAVAMVVELLRRNASPAQVLAFGNSVESDVVSGLPAEEAAVLRLHSFGANTGDVLTSPSVDITTGIRPGNLGTTNTTPKTPKRRP